MAGSGGLQSGEMSDCLPLVRREIAIAGRVWLVETVDDEDALLAAAEGRDQFPFGLMLWESAVALAEELASPGDDLRGWSVLELGAGLGLAGVVAAALGARVVQTDHDGAALAACARTAQLNGVASITRAAGDWHAWQDDARYHVILGADIAYDVDDHAAIMAILARNLAPDGVAILADPGREAQAALIAQARTMGWDVVPSERRVADLKPAKPGATIEVTILRLRRGAP
jgi:methyltransferase-like protein 23